MAQFDGTGEEDQQAGDAAEQEQQAAGHPAWDEAWKDVPDVIREQQRPFFEKMDRQYRELDARYTPYKDFEQSGVAPERIQSAIQLQQALVEDPRGFWEKMAESWGFTPGQQQALADEIGDLDPNDPIAQRLARIEAQQQARDEATFAQQSVAQQQWVIQQETAKVDNGLKALESKVGKLSEDDRVDVIEWALKNASTGRNPDVAVAYYELQAYKDRILANTQRVAPRVLGGGGGAAAHLQENKKPMTDDERLQAALNLGKTLTERMAGQ